MTLPGPATPAPPPAAEARPGETSAASDRVPELDGIRGIAVMLVILYHAFFWSMNDGGSLAAWPAVPALIAQLTRVGWLGVDLFFVLSGFLITGILIETRSMPHYLRNFYGRRVLRILPLYYLLLAAVLLLYPGSWSFVLLSIAYLANVTPLLGVDVVYPALWSLAVEEHFYLVWPWVVRMTGRRTLAALAGLLCVGEPLLRVAGFYAGSNTYLYTWYRLDGLAYGALLAIFLRSPACTRQRLLRLGGAAAALGLLLLAGGARYGILSRRLVLGASLQYSAAQLAFAGLIAATLSGLLPLLSRLLRSPLLRRCGDLSYCLYLFHSLLFDLFDRVALRTGATPKLLAALGRFGEILVRAAVVLALAIGLAELSFRYLETPILRLKRRFPYHAPPAR